MALILNIDTATELASVSIQQNETVLAYQQNEVQQTHAAFIHTAIEQMLQQTHINLSQIEAIAVVNGPGSYTGLRVAVSTAKGLAYTLNKPIIAVNTLLVMATAAKEYALQNNILVNENTFFLPMIDARRDEIFTAGFNHLLQQKIDACSHILSTESFKEVLDKKSVIISGSGAEKSKKYLKNEKSTFLNISHTVKHLGNIAQNMFKQNSYLTAKMATVCYLKPFYSTVKSI